MKKTIRLTESDLHKIVKESVNKILKESVVVKPFVSEKVGMHIVHNLYGR